MWQWTSAPRCLKSTARCPEISYSHLVQSGFTIGRDIMGTMANTLILAYIGSSLTTVLLYASYQASLSQLLNRELIIVELLQALSGSIGILCTIPISAFIASALCCLHKCNSAQVQLAQVRVVRQTIHKAKAPTERVRLKSVRSVLFSAPLKILRGR